MYPLKNLRRRAARTGLTVAGVSLAVTLAIIMFSISEGIRESTDEIIEVSGIDILILPKGGALFIGTGEFDDSRELAQDIMDSNPEVKGAYPVLRERMYISTGQADEELPKVTSALAKGLTREANLAFETAEVISGSELPTGGDPFHANGTYDGGTESSNFTHEILLSRPLADFLDAHVGDIVYLSNKLPVTFEHFDDWLGNATWFIVEGIRTQSFEDEGDYGISLHLSELQYITGKWEKDAADILALDLHNPAKAEGVKQWLLEDFEGKDDITAYTQEDVREEIERFTATYRGFAEMVAGITILVAVLFVSTIVMISVKERTGELAALRALGFSRTSIFKLVLAESLLICIIGFAIGLAVGAVGVELINNYAESVAPELPEGFEIARITYGLLLWAVGSITIIGVLVGLVPAYWASHLNIASALKSE
ncbi:MAG: ABC transporter permease [Thermoplasmata archaeon]|nr:MAG: ABC transporter permease [Thermoplasmata archaeon]